MENSNHSAIPETFAIKEIAELLIKEIPGWLVEV